MTGFNPIREDAPPPEVSLRKNLRDAVALVASAMREGMLDSDQVKLLEQGGIRKTEAKQTAYETFEDLLGMAQAIKNKIINGDTVQIDDTAELAKLVGVVVKLMDMVRKSISEARRNEELTALETALHGCLADLQESTANSVELQAILDAAMKSMMRNLEDRMKQIQAKYEE